MNSKIYFTLTAGAALALASALHAEPRISLNLNLGGPPPPVVVHRAPPRPEVEERTVSPGPDYVWVAGHHAWRGGEWVWVRGSWERPPQQGAVWVESRWDERNQSWVDGYWTVEHRDERDYRDHRDSDRMERDRMERDRLERERQDRERMDRERADRDRMERERLDRERAEQARLEREREDRDRMERERRDRERQDHVITIGRGGIRGEIVINEAPPPPRHEVRMESPGPDYVWIDGYWGWDGHRHEWVAGHWERPPHGHGHWEAPRWEQRNGSYVFIQGNWR